ncbi:MAG: hypothetical protein ACR2KZ_18900, partial [Segetibacter sp.]
RGVKVYQAAARGNAVMSKICAGDNIISLDRFTVINKINNTAIKTTATLRKTFMVLRLWEYQTVRSLKFLVLTLFM